MLENIRIKYILSVISLLLVTALVVITPYGFNYINDSITEGQPHNDGTFSYSAGKNALTYDEVRILLQSDPVWINEKPGIVDADLYNEIYSALKSFNSAMEGNDYMKEITGYPLSNDDMELSYCTASKVSGVVDNEPMTVNLMTVAFYSKSDSLIFDITFMYNRDNLKVYEYICNFNIYDSAESSVSEELPLEEIINSFEEKKLVEYFDTTTKSYQGEFYYGFDSLSIFALGGVYNYNSFSYNDSYKERYD